MMQINLTGEVEKTLPLLRKVAILYFNKKGYKTKEKIGKMITPLFGEKNPHDKELGWLHYYTDFLCENGLMRRIEKSGEKEHEFELTNEGIKILDILTKLKKM
jgi:predicted transcriptional regulator